jgi:hypothetical protein
VFTVTVIIICLKHLLSLLQDWDYTWGIQVRHKI